MIVHLISSPRNISTAMMYSFANRGDLKVVDEPFYAYYLNKYRVQHPGFEEIVSSQPTLFKDVAQNFRSLEKEHNVVFLKDMAQHIEHLDLSFLLKHKIIILIRDPKEQIYSFSKVYKNPIVRDIGIKAQYDIVQYLDEQQKDFVIVDSNVLLQDPERILSKLCNEFEIPFSEKMIQWKAGALKEDGVWAKFWYDSVHRSTGFKKVERKNIQLEGGLNFLYNEVKHYYKALSKRIIQ